MDFHIANTFTDSLARLTGDEQKAVKTMVFDLQLTNAGGETTPDNLALACVSCSLRKQARRSVREPQTGRPVVLCHS
jgi:hypothetical protein